MLSNGAILKLSHYLVAIAGVVCVLNVAPKTKDTKHKHIFSDIQEVYGDFQAKARRRRRFDVNNSVLSSHI